MSGFRGSDECLDREIETLESVARLRLKRYAREMAELERDMRELRRERVRRRARAEPTVTTGEAAADASVA